MNACHSDGDDDGVADKSFQHSVNILNAMDYRTHVDDVHRHKVCRHDDDLADRLAVVSALLR